MGTRPFDRMEATLITLVVLAAVGMGYGFSRALDSGAAGAVGRNTALLTGLMLLSGRCSANARWWSLSLGSCWSWSRATTASDTPTPGPCSPNRAHTSPHSR